MARRVQLPQVPDSVEHLQDILREKLQLQGAFTVQFEDPDFSNALCDLSDIAELPAERAVLHILWDNGLSSLDQTDAQSSTSISSLDTGSVSSAGSPQSPSTHLRSNSQWPSPFIIPLFSYDVELKLRKGNENYEKTKKGLSVTRDMKMEILDKIAQAIFVFKGYPDKHEVASVASALVLKYPCLTEPGAGTGWDGWKISIKYKVANYRSKLREAGCNEVNVNRKRGQDGDEGRFTLKKPKRGEVNHVPDYPDGQDADTLEEQRLALVDEMKKKRRDAGLIRQKMQLTFSLRRKEIIEVQPMVSEVQARWPALFSEDEVR